MHLHSSRVLIAALLTSFIFALCAPCFALSEPLVSDSELPQEVRRTLCKKYDLDPQESLSYYKIVVTRLSALIEKEENITQYVDSLAPDSPEIAYYVVGNGSDWTSHGLYLQLGNPDQLYTGIPYAYYSVLLQAFPSLESIQERFPQLGIQRTILFKDCALATGCCANLGYYLVTDRGDFVLGTCFDHFDYDGSSPVNASFRLLPISLLVEKARLEENEYIKWRTRYPDGETVLIGLSADDEPPTWSFVSSKLGQQNNEELSVYDITNPKLMDVIQSHKKQEAFGLTLVSAARILLIASIPAAAILILLYKKKKAADTET